jgi:hypothetical protein
MGWDQLKWFLAFFKEKNRLEAEAMKKAQSKRRRTHVQGPQA